MHPDSHALLDALLADARNTQTVRALLLPHDWSESRVLRALADLRRAALLDDAARRHFDSTQGA